MASKLTTSVALTALLAALLAAANRGPAQDTDTAPPPFDPARAVERGCEILLEMQEEGEAGKGRREWPYEGVYRTNEGDRRRVIPIGYRVGGTAIAALALIEAPGYGDDEARQGAVARGVEFVLEALALPLMQPSTEDVYDVRGWGHIYALALLVRLEERELVPKTRRAAVAKATRWLIDALEESAIDGAGGWSYANHRAPSPFMTAPALQALFHASARGHEVDEKVIDEALAALERGRATSGSIAYTTPATSRADTDEEALRFMDKLPGAIARMSAVETTLLLAGRGSQARLRRAVEAFFEHWIQLERRRKQSGTHVQPYGVAPYYFVYGHYYVAQAIERIDDAALRSESRERFLAILAGVQEDEGGWNDRVFPRSRNFGTAMGMMAATMKDLPAPATWPTLLKKR